ncbi:uncharacterized protein C8R40DRAFT_1212117 [Lentinula edodes]|uniref:uncharacterized protein n=1 Tax=Lentinula edodes TaxID=5353 RepID=UPI001E8EB09F|nr:uncharacterized protein C8R40DRAFT_1212117 [Lentinula edodes]KAH7870673.1 hypothetical protein C8R40DRAFT_1212117 [Lentinula edodes]
MPSTPFTRIGKPPPWIAYCPALSPSIYLAANKASSPFSLLCMYQVLQPQRSTVAHLRATQESLSGCVPDQVTE